MLVRDQLAECASIAAGAGTEAFVMTLAGIASGGLVALWATRLLDSLLWGLPHMDGLSLAAAEALLVGISVAGCLTPAHRAARADPLEVLRDV